MTNSQMIRIIKFYTYLFCLLILTNVGAQTDLQIGEWESHLSYQRSNWITQSQSTIYVSTGNAIIKISKQDINDEELINPEYLTKIDGLTEAQIDKIKFDPFNNQLIVIYQSSNIDIIRPDGVFNIPFIKDNTSIVGSRSINDIHIADENTCYLAGAFGVINMDLKKLEFRFTTFTPTPALSISSDENSVYLGLDDGLYIIAVDDSNPINFSRWQVLGSEVGLPTPFTYSCNDVIAYNGSVYASINGNLYQSNNGVYDPLDIDTQTGYAIQFMTAERENLIIGIRNFSDRRSQIRRINKNGQIDPGGADCISEVIYGIESETGRVWYADGFRGIRYTNGFNFGCKILTFDSPRSNECSQIEVKKDQVFFASGGASDNYAILSNREGMYVLEDNKWNNVNETRYPVIVDSFFINFVSVAPHPKENKVYLGSYWGGVMSYDLDTEEIEFFDAFTPESKLQGVTPTDKRARVSFVAFDDDENLWISNFGSPDPLVVKTKDDIWYNYSIPGNNNNLAKMVIDDNGYIWATIIGNNGGLLVYDTNGTLANPLDDRKRILTNTDSEIPSPQVNCLAVDLNGDVWVGTNQGPVSFECDPFDITNCNGNRQKVTEDDIGALLLETEEVLCIEIDGANRKWFGTKNGIFVQSPTGTDKIDKFDESNSPLFSNTVIDLDFDEVSGRMYISTNNGIQSIRTATTGATTRHSNTVFAFPNPVTPDYNGPIAIKGLGQDANVKITDLNGKLIYETTALGGQAIWDGQDYNGRKAAAGVYLVFSSSRVSFDMSDEYVTKIMVID